MSFDGHSRHYHHRRLSGRFCGTVPFLIKSLHKTGIEPDFKDFNLNSLTFDHGCCRRVRFTGRLLET